MIRPTDTGSFWRPQPAPAPLADPIALTALAHILGLERPATPTIRATTAPATSDGPVRAGGRIVGIVLPFTLDAEGPVYAPARGPGRIRELVDEGIIA